MLGRRSFLASLALGWSRCSRCERGAGEPPSRAPATASTAAPALSVDPTDAGTTETGAIGTVDPRRGKVKTATWSIGADGKVFTIVPEWTGPDEKLPLLVALHGRGEANKGPALGVMGWPKDYMLLRAIERVSAPPLTTDDFEGFVEPERLAQTNAALERRAFAGLVVICPYSWDVDLRKPPQIKEYGDYLMNTVLPKAKKELPVLGTAASIGIDGVSLGGALALRIGLGNASSFGAVGTLQPAIGEDQVPDFTELAKMARANNPRLALRLLTSKEDYFKRAIKAASQSFKAAGLAHDFEELPGPHDYPFNRGPGAIEMLLWHDRLLARA